MNLNDNQKASGTGRSRGRGSSKNISGGSYGTRQTATSRSTGTTRSGSATARSSSARSSVGSRSGGSGYGGSGRRGGGSDFDFVKLAVGGVILIAAIACIVFLVKGMSGGPKKSESETETTTVEAETELQKEVSVDGINITGLSREDAKAAILKDFGWGMKVTWQDQSIDVADLMAGKVDSLLNEIYTGEPKETYTLDTSGLEDAAKTAAADIAAKWDKKPKNGSISSYDAASDKFVFAGAESGQAVDQDLLVSDILAALKRKEFDATIAAAVSPVEPEFSEATAREKYKTVATFTTKTTANAKRNTNVKLAAQAVNGTVLQPGEEFSFNGTVGERTEAKGYKGAAAYNNGEVVEEIGGGVCQVSSTLYNAVLKAGLKTTVRRSHTFEPSYVTPGTDAAVSWGSPDYKFVNNSDTAIGIRASYSDQTMTVSIYAIPLLEEGVSYALKSTKIKDMDPPAPTYEEDPTLAPGVEKNKSNGSIGSYWETKLIVTKNGEVISDKVDHTVTYKGHPPVVLRNTSGTMAETQPSESSSEAATIDPNQSAAAPQESSPAGDGPVSGPGSGSGAVSGAVSGPGGSPTTVPGAESTAPTQGVTTAPTPTPTTAASTPDMNAPGQVVDSNAPQMVPPMS
ncbi:MAG: VanW family protein [Lachnospiraceae bacterium]|nr:VanW family protein [Lachnospiraceae bacterium]